METVEQIENEIETRSGMNHFEESLLIYEQFLNNDTNENHLFKKALPNFPLSVQCYAVQVFFC